MKNCCANFLFFCSLSGVLVFIILGIFTYTDNSYLIIENIKKDDNGNFTFDKSTKKKAYLQYFIAALFDCLFASLIYIISSLCENEQKSSELIQNKPTYQAEIEVINSLGNQDNINNNNNENINNMNNEIITNNNDISNEIIENKGMSEKDY